MVSRLRPRPILTGAAVLAVLYILLAIHSEYWLGVVTTHPIGDDYKIYYGAYLKALAGENPYEPYGIGSGFIYHPAALTFVGLLAWEGQWPSTYVWIAASAFAWAASIWLALKLAAQVWAGSDETRLPPARKWLVAGLFAVFAPFWETLHIGQNNTFVVLCLLLTLYYNQKRPFIAGAALAIAIVLKTSPILLLAWLLVMQKYRALFWAVVLLAGLSGLALLQFSSEVYVQYWQTLPRLGAELHPDTYNQSILSVVYQTFPYFAEHALDSTLVLVYRAAAALVSGGLLLVGFIDYRKTGTINIWVYAGIISALVIFSPLVWYHHTTLLLLPLTLLLASPVKTAAATGLGLMFLIQAERLFEQEVSLTAYPMVLAHILLLGMVSVMYVQNAPKMRGVASLRYNLPL
jgi:Glycosyltransferase family 87